jgi:hypothetical protein
MGCDIHFYVERWTSSNNYGGPRDLSDDREQKLSEVLEDAPTKFRWVSADNWQIEDGEWQIDWNDEYYGNRNYYIFGILADVRNDGGVEPIDYPKGIPDDASTGYLYKCEQWDSDGHSHSYFTLDELLNVDWSEYEPGYISDFMETLEKMKEIDEDPLNVRCCFFFDN